jgi:hypothetical protein
MYIDEGELTCFSFPTLVVLVILVLLSSHILQTMKKLIFVFECRLSLKAGALGRVATAATAVTASLPILVRGKGDRLDWWSFLFALTLGRVFVVVQIACFLMHQLLL